MLKIEKFVFYFFQENSYVVSDDSGSCAIIDPGCERAKEKEQLHSYIAANKLTPEVILLTHGHLDHIYGVADCVRRYNVPVYMDAEEELSVNVVNSNFAQIGVDKPEAFEYCGVADGDLVHFGTSKVRALSTPGHSKGGLCWWFEKENILFSGDTLFRGTVGRTDLAGGSLEELKQSLCGTLMQLDGDISVYPGHGAATSIGFERTTNPFIYEDYTQKELIEADLERIAEEASGD